MAGSALRYQVSSSSDASVWKTAWPISLSIHVFAFAVLYFLFSSAGDPLSQASVVRELRLVEASPTLEDRPMVRSEAGPSLSSLLEVPTSEGLSMPLVGEQLASGPSVIGLNSGQDGSGASAVFSTGPRESPPEVTFFGSSAVGYKIVFVVDRSGSMWDQFGLVREELLESLAGLEPSQQFQLVFFSSGKAWMMSPADFLDASKANKQAAYDFLQQIGRLDPASGLTDPGPALWAALALPSGPTDVIFLLSDGDFSETLLATVQQGNPQARTQINTIGFGYEGGSKLLRALAANNRGAFRFVQSVRQSKQAESSLDALLR